MPNTKWHSVSIDLVSGLPSTTRGHDAIMTVVDQISKRGMFIPCWKDMTADDLVYVFLRELIRLKECLQHISSHRDKLFESEPWKELAQRFKMEMHQTVANSPRGNGLLERGNQLILQRLRTHGIFGNNEWDVDLQFAEIHFNNPTSNGLRVAPFEIDEGCTPHFSLDFPRMPSILCVQCLPSMWSCHVVLKMNRHVGVPEVGERWWVVVPEYRK